jgi:putative ABC transport system permease protein
MQTLWQDLRYGARMLVQKPGFTLIAALTLAIGIGANVAIFSVVNALLLRPLPFDNLDRIVAVFERTSEAPRNEAAAANYFDWRDQNQVFEHIGMYRWWAANLTGVEMPERAQGFMITANLFDALGAQPALGRRFTPEEEQPGRDGVVILNHGFWQRRFGGDPGIVGRTIHFDGTPRTVVGVMPPEYNFPPGGEMLAPLALTPQQKQSRRNHTYLAVARLKPGVSIEQARADLDAIAGRLERQYPQTNAGWGVAIFPLLDHTVRQYGQALLVLMGAVGFVLLIACANLANLTLARATGREKEMAIRAALGARRHRIIRQLLTESVVLAIIGGAAGTLLALWGVEALKSAMPGEVVRFIPGWVKVGIDAQSLVFTLGLSLLTGLAFGLAPALAASRPDLNATLKEGGKSPAGFHRRGLRSALVIAEIAISLALLVGAGLMVKSFLRLINTDPGFNPENVLTMELLLPRAGYAEEAQRAVFFHQLLERVEALPGVEMAGVVSHLPLGGSNASAGFLIEGRPEPPPGQGNDGRYRVCSPRYFEALGIRLLRGRAFTEQDREGAAPVVIVNETLARQHWPNEDAVGHRIRFTGDPAQNPWMMIVGVVRDVKHTLDGEVKPEYYLPHAQDAWRSMSLVVRAKREPMALAPAIRNQVLALDKDQPVFLIRTMEQVRAQSVLAPRFAAVALGLFAALALILAMVGIYGVMSYAIAARTHELGIRLALGARPLDVLMLALKQGLTLTLAGVAIGLAAAFAMTRLMSELLFEVSATDPLTFAGTALLLTLVALLACWIPARRATKVDPMEALRHE